MLGGAFEARHPERIYVPKASGLHRPLALLNIEDQIILQAFANLAANRMQTKRAPLQFKVVFSNILKEPDRTGSYGVALARFVRRHAGRVGEVNHCDRRKRRHNGKNDTIDAETAARSVLAGIATAVPKTADGASEMVRQIKIARDTAVKARSSAIIALKALIVNAPGELRETLEPLTDRQLIKRCAALEPGDLIDPTASIKHALRALATRWLTLSTEIDAHDEALDTLTMTAAPLSPRVRGSPPGLHPHTTSVGSIPACAGKPRTRTPPAGIRRVYPRVCGEATCEKGTSFVWSGLSPRVRGSR